MNRGECIPFAFRVYATYEVNSRLSDLKLHAIIDKLSPELRYKFRPRMARSRILDLVFEIKVCKSFFHVIFSIIFIDLVNIRHIKSDMADIFRNSF